MNVDTGSVVPQDLQPLQVLEKESTGEQYVEDPAAKLVWYDWASYDCPEDLTCGRDLAPWIAEVNNLRARVHRLQTEFNNIP